MEYAFFLSILLLIPAAIWLGTYVWQDRDRRHHKHPPSTDGGPPTIYRRRMPPDEPTGTAT